MWEQCFTSLFFMPLKYISQWILEGQEELVSASLQQISPEENLLKNNKKVIVNAYFLRLLVRAYCSLEQAASSKHNQLCLAGEEVAM